MTKTGVRVLEEVWQTDLTDRQGQEKKKTGSKFQMKGRGNSIGRAGRGIAKGKERTQELTSWSWEKEEAEMSKHASRTGLWSLVLTLRAVWVVGW